MGDGSGWTTCGLGHRHWGRFGAAGVLVTDGRRVVLQQRAERTHEGGTWSVPGGARDSHETTLAAAMREATEETTLDPAQLTPFGDLVDDHGGWAYTTVLASAPGTLEPAAANWESIAVRWWPIRDVTALPLHHGFARSWPALADLLLAHD